MGRIGIYGGTFNPPHTGHILAIREFAEKLKLDRVLMIPASVPPHKEMPVGSPDAQTRLQLCRLAASELDCVTVSELELRREGRSYTVDTVRELKQQYPEDELILLMGTDMFLSFDRWWMPEEIVRNASLAMANRSDPTPEMQQVLAAQKEKLETELGANVSILQNELIEISSTAVRQLLIYGAGESVLPAPVYREILRLGLYGTSVPRMELPFEQLRQESLLLHKPRRVPHVEGCLRFAVHLAEKWGADAEKTARAAILHDVTKILGRAEQLILCHRYDILLDDFDRQNESLLHAKTGAAVARAVFGESNEVCEAIRWHTTGKPVMTKMQKIIYLADMIEETRKYPGVEELRKLAEENLDEAVRCALERTISFVQDGGKLLHPDSVAALQYEIRMIRQGTEAPLPDNKEVDK